MNQNAGAHYGEKTRRVWIGGLECESIIEGLAMLRTMSGEPDIPYHVLYHAIRKGRNEVRGVSISMTAPRSSQERPRARPEPRPSEQRTPGPLLARVCTAWLGVHH